MKRLITKLKNWFKPVNTNPKHVFTESEKDYIIIAFLSFVSTRANPGCISTYKELADELNKDLGLNKSTSAYKKIWSDHLKAVKKNKEV